MTACQQSSIVSDKFISTVPHRYAKSLAVNTTNTHVLLNSTLYTIDGNEEGSIGTTSRACFSDTSPNIIWAIGRSGGGSIRDSLVAVDIANNNQQTFHYTDDTAGGLGLSIGSAEGQVRNDKYVVIHNQDTNRLTSLELTSTGAIVLGSITPESWYNWASFSHDGNYIIVASSANDNQRIIYDKNFNNPRSPSAPSQNHGDLITLPNGAQAYYNLRDNNNGVLFFNGRDGSGTPDYHDNGINGKNNGHACGLSPGVVLISGNNGQTSFIVGLDNDGREAWRRDLGDFGSNSGDNAAEATMSVDASRIIYTTQKNDGAVETYIMTLNNSLCVAPQDEWNQNSNPLPESGNITLTESSVNPAVPEIDPTSLSIPMTLYAWVPPGTFPTGGYWEWSQTGGPALAATIGPNGNRLNITDGEAGSSVEIQVALYDATGTVVAVNRAPMSIPQEESGVFAEPEAEFNVAADQTGTQQFPIDLSDPGHVPTIATTDPEGDNDLFTVVAVSGGYALEVDIDGARDRGLTTIRCDLE